MDPTPENPEEEFKFYLKFAKPFILNLSNSAERVRAATWIKKLMEPSEADGFQLKNDYLKLLLFGLQRESLGGPFANLPNFDAPLPPFPDNLNLSQMVKQMLDADTPNAFSASGEPCSYMVSVSSDLKEYACAQEIPNFGVHCYYAISADPITAWKNADKAHCVPKLRTQDLSQLDTSSPSSTRTDVGNTTERGDRMDVTFDESGRTIEQEGHGMGRGTRRQGRGARGTASEASRSGADFFQLEDRPDDHKRDEYFENFDPLAGQSEIRSNLASMMRILEELQNHTYMRRTHAGGAQPTFTAHTLSQTVEELCGSGFQGSIASTKKYRSKERLDRSDRSIVQGHVIATSDPVDGSIIQLHKAMSIQHQQVPNEAESFNRTSTSPQSLRRKATPDTEGNLVPVDGRFSNYPNLVTSTPLSPLPSSPIQEHTSYRQEEPSPGNVLNVVETQLRRSSPGQQETVNIVMKSSPRKNDKSQRQGSPTPGPHRRSTSPRGNTPQQESIYGTPEARSPTRSRPKSPSPPRDSSGQDSNLTPFESPCYETAFADSTLGEDYEIHDTDYQTLLAKRIQQRGPNPRPAYVPWYPPNNDGSSPELSPTSQNLKYAYTPRTKHEGDWDPVNNVLNVHRDPIYEYNGPFLYNKDYGKHHLARPDPTWLERRQKKQPLDDRSPIMEINDDVPCESGWLDKRQQRYEFETLMTKEELDALFEEESDATHLRAGIPRYEPPEYGVYEGPHDGGHPDYEQVRAYGRERKARLQHESAGPSQKPAGTYNKPAGTYNKPAGTYNKPAGTYKKEDQHQLPVAVQSVSSIEASYTQLRATTRYEVENMNTDDESEKSLYETAGTTAWEAYNADKTIDDAADDYMYDTARDWEVTDADANIDNEVSVSEISYSETAFTTVWEVTDASDE